MKHDSNDLPKIAILGGTGKEGPGLAMRWASVGYTIIIGSRETDKAQRVAAELNEKLGLSSVLGMQNDKAARTADICVLTVVYSAHQSALTSLKESLQNKILVDTTARVDFRDPAPPPPPSAGRIAQGILGPEVRVVSALQTIPAHVLKQNLGNNLDADVLVCSDDLNAAEQVIRLIKSGGMRGYYAGGLDNAIVVEGLTSILISLNRHYNVKTASIGITGV
jgi:NADPH-dependent F420 reductase